MKTKTAVAVSCATTAALLLLIQIKMNKTAIAYKNLRAFLIMIQYSEGTFGKDGYNKLYGGSLFQDFSRHPNQKQTKWGLTSTAAGAYQILSKTWAELQTKLQLPDFSPTSQDKAAVELIRRRKALDDVYAGRFTEAIAKCRKEWASLPGAGYGQNEKNITNLLAVIKASGGTKLA